MSGGTLIEETITMSSFPMLMESASGLGGRVLKYGAAHRDTRNLVIDLAQELETLKKRNKEDKRLKEKFPKINGEPTWLLRHIELLQEAYKINGWEHDVEIPKECLHRIRRSLIDFYLIFTRDKKGRKGKVAKEYISVPLANGASWGTWKAMDDDARPPATDRLSNLPALALGELDLDYGILDDELDAYLIDGENPEDYEDYTVEEMGILPEDRPRCRVVSTKSRKPAFSERNANIPRRRVVSKSSNTSSSSGKVSTYSSRSFTAARTSAVGQDIMSSIGNYAPERSLRSRRKVSAKSTASDSTNNSSSSSDSVMSNGMPVPGSIRMPKDGEPSDSESLEADSGGGEEDEKDEEVGEEEEDCEEQTQEHDSNHQPTNQLNGRYKAVRNSDDEDEDNEKDEDIMDDKDHYAVKGVNRSKVIGDHLNDTDNDQRAVSTQSASKVKKSSNEMPGPSPYVENEYVQYEITSDEDEMEDVEIEYGDEHMGDIDEGEEGYDENGDEEEGYCHGAADEEWFDESGYCKFCELHQHECECIRGDENDPMDCGEEDDDEYEN